MKENQLKFSTSNKHNHKQGNIRVRLFKSIANEPEEKSQLHNWSISALCRKITQQNDEIKQLKLTIQQKQTGYNEMKKVLTEQINKISQNKAKKLSMQAKINSQLKNKQKELNKLISHNNQIDKLKQTQIVSKQQGQISIFKGILLSMKQKQQFWESQNANLNSKLSTMANIIKQTQQELSSVKKINSRLTEDCASFKDLYYEQKKQTQLLQDELNNLVKEKAIQLKQFGERQNKVREQSQKNGSIAYKQEISWATEDDVVNTRRRARIEEIEEGGWV